MKTFHIYTDASSKDTSMFPQGVKRTTKVGVIVVNSNIVDIYYKRREKFINSYLAERDAIKDSIKYVKNKYKTTKVIVYTDAYYNIIKNKTIKNLIIEGVTIKYIKGHCSNRGGKYRFNCLADWISRNGINTWKNYYYRHLLK